VAEFDPIDAWARYCRLVAEDPARFDNPSDGNIEILFDDDSVAAAQAAAGAARSARGLAAGDLRAGVLAEDPYMTYVRDAVRFADGSAGLYNRILEGPCVAVLPVLERRLVLIRIFRHGLRAWSWEAPRGDVRPDEPHTEAAARELREEIGAEAVAFRDLGRFTPGGASLGILGHLVLAEIDGIGPLSRAESIVRTHEVSADEMGRMIAEGQIYDGFTIALFARARLKGLI